MDKDEKISPNEFGEYLEKTLGLLKEVLGNVDSKPINPDVSLDKVINELLQIEKVIDEFRDLNKDALEQAKGNLKEASLSKETVRLLKKASELEQAALKKREWLAAKKKHDESKAKTKVSVEEQRPVKEVSQKKKFDRMARKKNWKPL
jgi:hypothetical protein